MVATECPRKYKRMSENRNEKHKNHNEGKKNKQIKFIMTFDGTICLDGESVYK